MNAGERLMKAAETYEERNKVYGNTYKRYGHVVAALFPKGVTIKTVDEHNRFGVLTMVIGKLTRYCTNFEKGGHTDSIHDLGVYAFMLEELDAEQKK